MADIFKNIFKRRSNGDIYKLIHKDDLEGLTQHLKDGGDPNQLDEYGQTPIYRVVANKSPNQLNMLAVLVDRGADINYERNDGTTPIFFAIGDPAKYLVSKGARYRHVSNSGFTPLTHCFDPTTVDYFISLGLDINSKDKSGRAALHDYVYFGSKLVEVAIKNNADVNILTADGQTPLLCLALTQGANEIDTEDMVLVAKKLIDSGASIDHTDNMGHDVYYYCDENKNFGLADWLKKNST